MRIGVLATNAELAADRQCSLDVDRRGEHAFFQRTVGNGVLVPHRDQDELGRGEDVREDLSPLFASVGGVVQDPVDQLFLDRIEVVTGRTPDHEGPGGRNQVGDVQRIVVVEVVRLHERVRLTVGSGFDLEHQLRNRALTHLDTDHVRQGEEIVQVQRFDRSDELDLELVVLCREGIVGEPQLDPRTIVQRGRQNR